MTRSRRTTSVLFGIGYVVLAGGYLLLARHESRELETKRQKRIEESPLFGSLRLANIIIRNVIMAGI